MKLYPPSFATPEESAEMAKQPVPAEAVSDEALTEYYTRMISQYRSTLDTFFGPIASSVPFYRCYPFITYIVRFGNGEMVGHRPNSRSAVQLVQIEDFDPPLEEMNFFDIMKRLGVHFSSFNFTPRPRSIVAAEAEGIRRAFEDALDLFWRNVDASAFSQLCTQLLLAEGIKPNGDASKKDRQMCFDTLGQVHVYEPAEFRRVECWAFEYKHHRDNRVTAQDLRQSEAMLEFAEQEIDVLCLITSGDLTSIGNFIRVENPKLRVWDRSVLQRLVNKHVNVLKPYFQSYAEAVAAMSGQPSEGCNVTDSPASMLQQFQANLRSCPTGQKYFARYEKIACEIWSYAFSDKLGPGKPQQSTSDTKQRRDVLFPNLDAGRFFKGIREKFGANFVIVDFKNYKAPVGSSVVDDAAKYANKAVGYFVVVVSRAGASKSVLANQLRVYRDKDTAVLVISDDQLLEMVGRKERGECPEDILEDLLQELQIRY